MLRRGGARNRRDRETLQLNEAQCRALISASYVCWERGEQFNRFVTIAWGKCGIDPQDAVAATGAWIKLAREWMRERGYRVPWAWVQEWGPRYGAHCHALIHVPPELAPLLGKRFSRWARLVIERNGGCYERGAVVTLRIGFGECPDSSPEGYRAAMLAKVHYMLKCAPEALEARLGMMGWGPKPWGRSCLTYGKRLSIWQGWQTLRVLCHQPAGACRPP